MKQRKIVRRLRRAGPRPDELARLKDIRRKVEAEIPPLQPSRLRPAVGGLPAKIRAAREARGLTWYAVARLAGIPNSNTIRDIEVGRDVRLSNLQAVAAALGLRLELVDSTPGA